MTNAIAAGNLDYNDTVQNLLREVMARDIYMALGRELKAAPELYDKYGFHGFTIGAGALLHYDQFRDGNRSIHDLDLEAVGNSSCQRKLSDPHTRGEYLDDLKVLLMKAATNSHFDFKQYATEALPPRQQAASKRRGKEKVYFDLSHNFTKEDVATILRRKYSLRDEEIHLIQEAFKGDGKRVIPVHFEIEVQPFYTNPLLHPRSRVGKEVYYAKDDKVQGVVGLMRADYRIAFASHMLRALEEPLAKRKATDLLDIVNQYQHGNIDMEDPIVRKLFIAMMVMYNEDPEKLNLKMLFDPSKENVQEVLADLKKRTPECHLLSEGKAKWYLQNAGYILNEFLPIDKTDGHYAFKFTDNEQKFIDLWFKGMKRGTQTIRRCDANILFEDVKDHPRAQGYEYLIDNINNHPLLLQSDAHQAKARRG